MKRFVKITGITIALFMMMCLTFSFVNKWWFYHLWYFGNRITINLTVEIDGKSEYVISENDKASIQSSESIRVKDCGGKYKISIPAHSYGDYEISFSMNLIPITLQLYQFNWWDVQEIDLNVRVDTANNKIYYNVKHTSLTEKAYKTTCYYSDEIMLDEYNLIELTRQKEQNLSAPFHYFIHYLCCSPQTVFENIHLNVYS